LLQHLQCHLVLQPRPLTIPTSHIPPVSRVFGPRCAAGDSPPRCCSHTWAVGKPAVQSSPPRCPVLTAPKRAPESCGHRQRITEQRATGQVTAGVWVRCESDVRRACGALGNSAAVRACVGRVPLATGSVQCCSSNRGGQETSLCSQLTRPCPSETPQTTSMPGVCVRLFRMVHRPPGAILLTSARTTSPVSP
jgi:hypothetical protein